MDDNLAKTGRPHLKEALEGGIERFLNGDRGGHAPTDCCNYVSKVDSLTPTM
jgi:hypothetical protein